MFDAGNLLPHETAPDAPGSREAKSAPTLPALSPRTKPAKRKRRTIADVRHAAATVSAKAGGLSVFDDRRIAAEGADRRQRAARFAARSYDPMPAIKTTNPKSTTPRRWQNVLSERHQDALAELVDYTRGARPDDTPEMSAEELSMVRWQSRTIPHWLAMAFRAMRWVPTSSGILFTRDPRPQFLLWYYGGADEFQHLVARHAARSVLYFAATCCWPASNVAVMWAVHDAIERVKFDSSAIAARRTRQKSQAVIGGRTYETDDDRARFVRMRRERFVRLRNIAERAIQKALRDSILALSKTLGTAPRAQNAIL